LPEEFYARKVMSVFSYFAQEDSKHESQLYHGRLSGRYWWQELQKNWLKGLVIVFTLSYR